MTDLNALARQRRRAKPEGMFLHHAAAEEFEHRLSMVKRTFTKTAIVTGHPDFWQRWMPEAKIAADEDALDLAQEAHDLVIHAMALHWANDPVGQLVQMRRALKPDGLMLAAFFGGQTLQELRSCLAEAEIALSGGLSPRIAPMGELRDLGGLLQRAGLALPVADTQNLTVEYKDIWHLMRDLQDMGEGNSLTARHKTFTPKSLFQKASEIYAAHFAAPDGRICASFEIMYLTGWAPAEGQQKPLRPGSARQTLAEALGTTETPLPD